MIGKRDVVKGDIPAHVPQFGRVFLARFRAKIQHIKNPFRGCETLLQRCVHAADSLHGFQHQCYHCDIADEIACGERTGDNLPASKSEDSGDADSTEPLNCWR